MTIHNFQQSLRKSQVQSGNPIWESVYRKAFNNIATMTDVRQDGWAQRGGIDRIVVLNSGKSLTFDEKVREKDYNDICLEYWSDVGRKIPGWVSKELACDYIAYAVLPTKRCYLLPFQQLRLAWRSNGRDWVQKYPQIKAQNEGYTTVSVGVPVNVVFSAINEAMRICWEEEVLPF